MSDSEYDSEVTVVAPVSPPQPPQPPTKKPKATPKATTSKRKQIAPISNAAALAQCHELPTTSNTQAEELRWAKKRKDIFGSDSEDDSEVTDVAPVPPPQPPTKKPKATPRATTSKRKQIAPISNAAAQAQRPTTSNTQEAEFPWAKKRKDIFSIIKSEERANTSSAGDGAASVITSSFTSKISGGQSRRTSQITAGDFFVEVKLYNTVDVQNTPPSERYKKALTSLKLRLDEDTREWETLQEFLTQAFKLFKNSNPIKFSDKITFK